MIPARLTLVFTQRTDWGKGMPDSKHLRWARDFSTDAKQASDTAKRVSIPPQAANDSDGWDHYRQWVSKAPAPRTRRAGIDPSLYTWKGYRNWTEQVRRNWNPDSPDDMD